MTSPTPPAEKIVPLTTPFTKAILDLSNSCICEVKSYAAPPQRVIQAMSCLLIVLGEDPAHVQDWKPIKVLLGKTGKLSLKRRVQEYNPDSLSVANATFAADVIRGIDKDELAKVSQAAEVFRAWSSAVVEDKLATL